MNEPPRVLPCLRFAFSRSIGDGSFEVEVGLMSAACVAYIDNRLFKDIKGD